LEQQIRRRGEELAFPSALPLATNSQLVISRPSASRRAEPATILLFFDHIPSMLPDSTRPAPEYTLDRICKIFFFFKKKTEFATVFRKKKCNSSQNMTVLTDKTTKDSAL
jgi:hypothetical protein